MKQNYLIINIAILFFDFPRIFLKFRIAVKLCLSMLSFTLLFWGSSSIWAQKNPIDYLLPVNTESPRATLKSFMKAMNRYKDLSTRADAKSKNIAKNMIERASETIDLSGVAQILQKQKGQEVAIYLKEIIDRIYVPDYSKIPGLDFNSDIRGLWRLGGTQIIIKRIAKGENKGEYLFSGRTAMRANGFYERVRHLPYLKDSGGGSGFQENWLKRYLPKWAQRPFLSLEWWQWVGLFLSISFCFIFKIITRYTLLFTLYILYKNKDPDTGLRPFLQSVLHPLSYLSAVGVGFVAIFLLQLQSTPFIVTTTILKLLASISIIWLAYRAVHYLSDYVRLILFKSNNKLNSQLAPFFSRSLKIGTIIAGILFTIQNLGINVASVLAGLGLGGLAFALAARDTVANLFGSLMILFDKPFQIGDWIKIGEAEGNVEDIGFRSTRIRTFYNSIVSIPNSEVAISQIDNMGSRKYRRVLANLSITYDTEPQKLEAFLEGIKNIIKANDYTRKNYFHVVFKEYGDSGLIIMVYFYLNVDSWARELLERQNIYFEIYRLAKELKVEFAFTTQTLHIETPAKNNKKESPSSPKITKAHKNKLKEIAVNYGKEGKNSQASGSGIYTAPFIEMETKKRR